MRPIVPSAIVDKFYLARLLDVVLARLEATEAHVTLQALSHALQIPEGIFRRLTNLYRDTDDEPNLFIEDYYAIFVLLMRHYPTLRLWEKEDLSVFIEI